MSHLEVHNLRIEEEMDGKEQKLRELESEINQREREKSELTEKVDCISISKKPQQPHIQDQMNCFDKIMSTL